MPTTEEAPTEFNIDEGRLTSALEKFMPQEETPKEEVSKEEVSKDQTPVKKEIETPLQEKQSPSIEDDPRYQEIIRRRDELQGAYDALTARQRQIDEFLSRFSPAELQQVIDSTKFLRSRPDLREKIEELMSQDPARVIQGVDEKYSILEKEIQSIKNESILREYDSTVNQLLAQHNIPKEAQGIYKRLLENSVHQTQAELKDIPKLFSDVHKEFDTFRRNELASYQKKPEMRVPEAPTRGAKPQVIGKESLEFEDMAKEIAAGIRAAKMQTVEE